MNNLTIFVLLVHLIVGSLGIICAPSCSKAGTADGTKVQNPYDCSEYYVCSDVNGDNTFEISDKPIQCPSGMYFSNDNASCVSIPDDANDYSDYCTGMCSPCEVVCSQPGKLLADPFSCQGYYMCLSGSPYDYIHAKCENGLQFDYLSSKCLVSNATQCYDLCDPCRVYCVREGRMVNPYDCKSYYYCEPPNQVADFHCMEGFIYDGQLEDCVTADHCTTTCQTFTTPMWSL